MNPYQPRFGNGASPRGRRIVDDTPDAFEIRKGWGADVAQRANKLARSRAWNGGGKGGPSIDGMKLRRASTGPDRKLMTPEQEDHVRRQMAGDVTRTAANYPSGSRTAGPRSISAAQLRRSSSVGKSRFYDPEARRQRRLGAGEAVLAGGSVAGLALGGKGIVRTSRLARKMPGVVSASNKDAQHLREALRHGVAARRKDVGIAAGGVASGLGAVAVNRHAESRRGRPYN